MTPFLTIAMPCFNEEGCVEAVVREALAVLDVLSTRRGVPGEVIVVDDGSTDGTPNILSSLAASDSRLRVIRHDTNQGIAAFNPRMLKEARGEWVLFISSDGEFDPNEAFRFLDLAEKEQADAVLGYRAEKNYTPYRKAVSWAFNSLTFACFGAKFHDIGSMRMLRRSLFQPIPLYSKSAFLNAERLLAGRKRGAVIVEVAITHRKRLTGIGTGSKPRKVAAAFADLLRTRSRFLRYQRYYSNES